jgi:membrane associated rhomboid family serine protease
MYLFAHTPIWLKTPITTILVVITFLVSYRAFNDRELFQRLLFRPYAIARQGEWHRFLTAGFVHANWLHLAFNLFVLWEFGSLVERSYAMQFGKGFGPLFYAGLYLIGLVTASLYSYHRHEDNPYYAAVGASGAVSGVVFAAILFYPTMPLTFVFLPFVKIPAVVMGLAYLAYSSYMSRRGGDNIGHDAHFWGSVWGFVYTALIDLNLLREFWEQIRPN